MSRRDVETDLRHQLSRDAVIGEAQLRRSAMTTVDSVLDYLVSRAYGDPERLLDAMDLLGQQDADARALLTRAARRAADPLGPAAPPTVAFLPPFDPLVWDRPLLGSLFGFDYVWELFLPPAKRRWGWYVLPILFRDRFIGRIEPRIDRDRARVEVLGLWWDDGFAPRPATGFVDAMRHALGAYLRFAGTSRLDWAPHLAADKQLFPELTG